MHRVRVTEPGKRDIQSAFQWWKKNRSAEQAERWYSKIFEAMASLRTNPERCGLAAENPQFEIEIRQLLFTIGRRPTHRVLFTISEESVTILRIRHVAQNLLGQEDIIL